MSFNAGDNKSSQFVYLREIGFLPNLYTVSFEPRKQISNVRFYTQNDSRV